ALSDIRMPTSVIGLAPAKLAPDRCICLIASNCTPAIDSIELHVAEFVQTDCNIQLSLSIPRIDFGQVTQDGEARFVGPNRLTFHARIPILIADLIQQTSLIMLPLCVVGIDFSQTPTYGETLFVNRQIADTLS